MWLRTLVILLQIFAINCFYYETKYIDVPIDHFSYTNNATFKMRYLINDTNYVEKSPIFFYTGNEGDIEMFAQNTGFMNEVSDTLTGVIVFAEHRYYGTSMPFGNESYSSPEKLGYLSSTQALADFVYLIHDLQKTYMKGIDDIEKLPVIAFGGSYGGMLAAWLRMKYPEVVTGAIASSAPIWQFKDLTPCGNFYRIVTNVFENYGSVNCRSTISSSWKAIRNLTATDDGKKWLSQEWLLCNSLKSNDDVEKLLGWLSNVIVNIAMVNYPYPNSFLVPLPGHPVNAFCSKIGKHETNKDLVIELGKALNVYTNYTGNTTCNNIDDTSESLGEEGWDFQACTEMIMPFCSTDDDMFENADWNFKQYSDTCYKNHKVRPSREDLPILLYGGKDIKTSSNIIFSNGLLDPWSSGGVLSNVSSKVYAVIIPEGAHHFDLRASNPSDTEDVKDARQFHITMIRKWLDEHYKNYYFDSYTKRFDYWNNSV